MASSKDGARASGGLQASGRIDDVAGDHALADRTQRHRGFAADDASPRRERCDARFDAHCGDRGDEFETSTNGTLGVILSCHRRSPIAITASPMNFSIVPP